MSLGRGHRVGFAATACLLVVALTACAPDVAGVEIASGGPTGAGPSAAPVATLDAEALAPLRAAAGLPPCPTAAPTLATGASALPDLTLPCLGAGPDVNLGALTDRPHVLIVWASWCGPCATEAPYLAEVYEEVGDRVGFLGIDFLDDASAALGMASKLGMTYPSVYADDTSLRRELGVTAPPWTLFVDASGHVVGQHPGPWTSSDALRDAIATHLRVQP